MMRKDRCGCAQRSNGACRPGSCHDWHATGWPERCSINGRCAQRCGRNLHAARLEDYIEKTLAAAPPLTAEQRARLAELLRPMRLRPGGDAA
jgi:hypothetical protein